MQQFDISFPGRFLDEAEISRLTPDERRTYRQRLKHYRDLKNVIATAYEDGREKAKTYAVCTLAERLGVSEDEARVMLGYED